MTKISSTPAAVDLDVYVGDANEIGLQILCDNLPLNIAGAQLKAQARLTGLDPTVAIEAGITIVDEASGTAIMAWDGESLRTLLAGKEKWVGRWDLQLLEAGKTLPRTLIAGIYSVVIDVTRAP